MSSRDTHLRSLLSPSRSGTLFAPFRPRQANPDGFDSKMKLWISAIEEWAVSNLKITFSINDIHQIFLSDSGIRPDKDCIRLVLSEMKRKSLIIPMSNLNNSELWSPSANAQTLIDPKGWIGWGFEKLLYQPASWAVSAFNITITQDETYSDLTDLSITDTMKFVCHKSIEDISRSLLTEFIRISKAEKQTCFDWEHLMQLTMPIINNYGKEILEMLDILIDYLSRNNKIAVQLDNDMKLIKIFTTDDNTSISRKDIAMARLMRAKELLVADADKFLAESEEAKSQALLCYSRKELAKAKSLLRTHKRLSKCYEQKEAQLSNVELLLDQLDNTQSNRMIFEAYKHGADALRLANTKLEQDTSVLDDVYDATAEAHHINQEMERMLSNISRIPCGETTTSDFEAELEQICLEEKLQNLTVCEDSIILPDPISSEPNNDESIVPTEASSQRVASRALPH